MPRIETHLRVAWRESERVYRYDRCDPEWHQIEVRPTPDGKSGVQEIASDVMIEEINEWKISKFDKSKTPMLFRRYDVNEEQTCIMQQVMCKVRPSIRNMGMG